MTASGMGPNTVLSALVWTPGATFTQVFTYVAPRLVGVAALYGTFVAVFGILAWLSIGFNVLLLGASWTRVRALAASNPTARPAAEEGPEPGSSVPSGTPEG